MPKYPAEMSSVYPLLSLVTSTVLAVPDDDSINSPRGETPVAGVTIKMDVVAIGDGALLTSRLPAVLEEYRTAGPLSRLWLRRYELTSLNGEAEAFFFQAIFLIEKYKRQYADYIELFSKNDIGILNQARPKLIDLKGRIEGLLFNAADLFGIREFHLEQALALTSLADFLSLPEVPQWNAGRNGSRRPADVAARIVDLYHEANGYLLRITERSLGLDHHYAEFQAARILSCEITVRLGNFRRAAEIIKLFISSSGGRNDIVGALQGHERYGDLLVRMGKMEEARERYRIVLEMLRQYTFPGDDEVERRVATKMGGEIAPGSADLTRIVWRGPLTLPLEAFSSSSSQAIAFLKQAEIDKAQQVKEQGSAGWGLRVLQRLPIGVSPRVQARRELLLGRLAEQGFEVVRNAAQTARFSTRRREGAARLDEESKVRAQETFGHYWQAARILWTANGEGRAEGGEFLLEEAYVWEQLALFLSRAHNAISDRRITEVVLSLEPGTGLDRMEIFKRASKAAERGAGRNLEHWPHRDAFEEGYVGGMLQHRIEIQMGRHRRAARGANFAATLALNAEEWEMAVVA
ncbi:MAG: hypothetical protein Q7S00_01650, partial [bacterium]|nr:hypothetical protein [bacterium]